VANGRANTGWFVAGTIVMVVLVATNTWNPFPDIWTWLNHNGPISDPAAAWQHRVGESPKSVTVAGDTMVVELGDSVEARRLTTGDQLWTKKVDWSAVAGTDADSAVVSGKLLVKGYDVVDPATGSLLRHDKQAVAVWTYRDAILDVRCHSSKDCTLTEWDPRATEPTWTVEMPGVGFVLFADNPGLKEVRPMTAQRIADHAGGPETMPRLLGFPIDGNTYVVDTSQGKVLPEVKPGRRDQIVVVGGRVLRITATAGDGSCYFQVAASDAVTGGEVWRQAGLNLRTASGSGCEQRNTPNGAENVVIGVGSDGRQALIDAYDGRILWVGATGEKVLDVDNQFALIRAADGKSIKGIQLGQSGTLWTRPVTSDAQALLTRYAAVISDRKPDRIVALNPETGKEKLSVRSSAKVLASGPDGLVVGDGRLVGYLPYGGKIVVKTTAPADTGGANPPDQGTRHGTEKDG
jgi:outer membrane protein assembly factor BamB